MDTKEMIKVMQAYVDGKRIEAGNREINFWRDCPDPSWNWNAFDYRIVPEPKKEGRWERVEIVKDDGQYCLANPFADVYLIDALPRIPGFGGIDYQSPFDEKIVVRSMGPVMISPEGNPFRWNFEETLRPGIPVAAWFWREE